MYIVFKRLYLTVYIKVVVERPFRTKTVVF